MKIKSLFDIVTRPYYRVRRKIHDSYYDLRKRCQRFARGYADEDVYEFAYNLIPYLEKILKQFIKTHQGYPGDSTPEEYDKKLNDMLYHLQWMDERRVESELMKKYNGYCKEYFEEEHNTLELHKNQFFKLFRELFWTLWD